MTLNPDQFAYRGHHQPDTSNEEVRFHELDKAMPDFYKEPRHYFHGPSDYKKEHREALSQALVAKGNPEASIRVYRAVPHGVETINPGDWVTTSRNYAVSHGQRTEDPSEDWPVIAATVRARDITFGGNDALEFGYAGKEPVRHIGNG